MVRERVTIFDTTLRDGEQSPGCSMTAEEKLRMAGQLALLKVDVIEAGFPAASPGDFDAVNRIARGVKGPVICGLARAIRKDIERCAEAVAPANRRRIHAFISSSDIHLKYQLKKSRDEVLRETASAVQLARTLCDDVEFSAMDATRSDGDYLVKILQTAVDNGATTLNVPDTVGYTVPSEFFELIRLLKSRIHGEGIILSVHCHNDLGLAVANSLAAVEAGARQVECTVNGIGERAGNCSLEELVMSLNVRRDRLPFKTGVDAKQIHASSKLLTSITGIVVQPNKAIVGENAFAHESGIHQDGVLKHTATYEIMTPESVGIPRNTLVLGKHSGRHALRKRLVELGVTLEDAAFEEVFAEFKKLADVKKSVYEDDLLALADRRAPRDERFRLKTLNVNSGNCAVPSATVSIMADGEERKAAEFGDGPVDAAFKAIRKLTGFAGTVTKYVVNSITGGTDAQGEVFVTVENGGKIVRGSGAHTDIIVASTMAFLDALNRLDSTSKPKNLMEYLTCPDRRPGWHR